MTANADYEHDQNDRQATPLELFFDLVFAFAVSQLSHHLSAHLSLRGGAETLTMLLAVMTVWSYTSWAATIVRAKRRRTLWMVLSIMLMGLFMNASIPRAFTESPWAFLIPLLAIQFGRTVWTIISAPLTIDKDHY